MLTDTEIREKNLQKGDFTPNWKGRVFILDPKNSMIAEKMGIEKEGEYAIKVR